nr:retrovirus-related Pol polyprotein LINE-1 [Tanacetum cinerariifolium]
MPDEWRLSEVIPIYKNKGDTQACSNYMGIKLLSHTMKIWERVIESRDLHMAFLDLEKAYDSIPRELVWKTIIDKGTPRRYSRVIKDMYNGAKTRMRTTVGNTDSFPVELGLHQGSAISPYLFTLIFDELSRGIQEDIPWCMIFADDIIKKTEYLRCDFSRYEVVHQEMDIRIRDRILQPKESFGYLGVLRDWRIPLKLKGKFYKVAIRPTMLYGSECWSITNAQATRVEVVELRMLRWICGKTMIDMIHNGVFRAELDVDYIVEKMREGRLRWFGHVKRRPRNASVRRVEAMKVKGSRRRGRPKLRWEDGLKMDMKELLLSEDMAFDRNAWRDRIRIIEWFRFYVIGPCFTLLDCLLALRSPVSLFP